MSNIKLTFHGGAGEVTGSNFHLLVEGRQFLVDCGIRQGSSFCEDSSHDTFQYNPKDIEILFVTHAHLDHIGKIPKLVRDGFDGKIISTPQTKEIAEISLVDSLGVLEREAKGKGLDPLYRKEDVSKALRLWSIQAYHKAETLGDSIEYCFLDAGHILGSAMLELSISGKRVVFTGDVGNSPAPLLRDTEKLPRADYLIMESVYGDRNHEPKKERTEKLRRVIQETIVRGGVLMIPAFSIERTQILLYELNELIESGEVPSVPVFLDSPFAIKVTDVYKRHADLFNKVVRDDIAGGDDIFSFPNLTFTESREQSMEIANVEGSKIIIAGSGMSNGGRIIHHEKRYLPHKENTLLIVGYQAAGSLGRKLLEGASRVDIHKQSIPVRAQVEEIRGYSAHKDSKGLLGLVEGASDSLKKVFVAMGEPKSAQFLAQRINDYLGVQAVVPRNGDVFKL